MKCQASQVSPIKRKLFEFMSQTEKKKKKKNPVKRQTEKRLKKIIGTLEKTNRKEIP
jgi:hypothetical protein